MAGKFYTTLMMARLDRVRCALDECLTADYLTNELRKKLKQYGAYLPDVRTSNSP